MERYTVDTAASLFPEASTQITVEGSTQLDPVIKVGRKRKGAYEYANQYQNDFFSRAILQNGIHVIVLVCKFCSLMIAARTDKIYEHLSSKEHIELKEAQAPVPKDSTPVKGRKRQRSARRIVSSTFIPSASSPSGSSKDFGAMRESNIYGNLGTASGELSNAPQPSTSSAFSNRSFMKYKDNTEINVEQDKVDQFEGRQQSYPPAPLIRNNSYHLQWETHGKIFRDSFINFQANEHLTDVNLILGCNMIKCHKVVLSACSEYFTSIFKQHPPTNPITIALSPDVFSQVKSLVHFMYHGEVTVPKKELKPLLKTAGELGIWGLTPRRITKPPSTIESVTESGNIQGRIVRRTKVTQNKTRQKVSRKHQPSRPTFPREQTRDCTAVNSQLHGVNSNDTFAAGASSMSVSQPPPWNISPLESSVALVNDGVLMTTGTGLLAPRLPRKRPFQPETTVMTEMLKQWNSVPALPDLISLKNNHRLPKYGNQMQAMTKFALTNTPDTSKGHEIGALPSTVNESIDRLHIVQGQYYSFGKSKQRERYANGNYASCSSSHDIDAVTDGGSGQERNIDGVISDGSEDTAGKEDLASRVIAFSRMW